MRRACDIYYNDENPNKKRKQGQAQFESKKRTAKKEIVREQTINSFSEHECACIRTLSMRIKIIPH